MAMLQANPTRPATTTAPREVDVRRLGLATLDGRSRHGGVRVPLPVAARLAEADRALDGAHRLLVLGAVGRGAAVDVTLADRSGAPVWMGGLPARIDVGGVSTGLPTDHDVTTEARRRTLAEAMSAVGFVPGTASWFTWVPPRTF